MTVILMIQRTMNISRMVSSLSCRSSTSISHTPPSHIQWLRCWRLRNMTASFLEPSTRPNAWRRQSTSFPTLGSPPSLCKLSTEAMRSNFSHDSSSRSHVFHSDKEVSKVLDAMFQRRSESLHHERSKRRNYVFQ